MKWSQTSVTRHPVLRRVIIICLAGILLAWGYFHWRIHAYDDAIAKASRLYGVDARLIRAVIWKESRFNPRRVGKVGEIGLMQVTRDAAGEWAAAARTNSTREDLFKPEVNIQAGTWYLGRAIRYWSATKPNPLPYALAEYNAGRSNTQRWAADDNNDANKFWDDITYPTTRRYVRDILIDYRGHR